MKRIRLQKMAELPDAITPNNIGVGDVRTGMFDQEPEVGKSFFMQKDGGGYFVTSPVTEVFDIFTFKTENSIYQIEYL